MRKKMALPALAMSATLFLSGCSAFEEPDDVLYCVDEGNKVVDQQKCDDDATSNGGAFWYMMGRYGTGLPAGSQLDSSQSTSRFKSNDAAARSTAGLTQTGKVSTGKSVTGKSGGFGTGSGNSGGFGSKSGTGS